MDIYPVFFGQSASEVKNLFPTWRRWSAEETQELHIVFLRHPPMLFRGPPRTVDWIVDVNSQALETVFKLHRKHMMRIMPLPLSAGELSQVVTKIPGD